MVLPTDIEDLAGMIERRDFVGWRGLPPDVGADALFGMGADSVWGERQLGTEFVPACSHLLDIDGYYRPIVYARDGAVVLFDGMNPQLAQPWEVLKTGLGEPDARLDWTYDRFLLAASEFVFASRGIAVFLNPDNGFVVFVSLFEATTLDCYARRLRIDRARRKSTAVTP